MGLWNLLKEVGNKVLPIVKPIAGMALTAGLSYMGQQFLSEMISPPKLWTQDPLAKEIIKSIGIRAVLLRHKEFADKIPFSDFMHAVIVSKLKRGGFGGPPGPGPE